MKYKIHPKIVSAIANVYTQDKIEINFGEITQETEVKSGIRQGCTGSTTVFKLET